MIAALLRSFPIAIRQSNDYQNQHTGRKKIKNSAAMTVIVVYTHGNRGYDRSAAAQLSNCHPAE
ncbi:hypothetical protein [uncultured Duncaniella sp.]|uniref:hypothetical protein n=1 Tax=uncultured Duncaniella sp. TaxID=2768039 RepID=UPI0025DC95AC|nr:hypothetical protein [uncultured Duncaniella sp.]